MFEERRIALAEAMAERGGWPADSPWVRAAVDAVPRHSFAPDTLWRWDGDAYAAVSRATEPERWAAEVYGEPLGTEVHVVPRGGHLAAEDGYGPWPAVERWALHGSFGPAPVAALV